MTPERHARAGEAFLRARGMSSAERTEFLAGITDDLRPEVERLLRNDLQSDPFLAQPLLDVRRELQTIDPAPEFPPQAGSYRILRTLGDGGSSTVYLAEQTAPVRRQVALKVLRHAGTRGEAAARFRAECEVIARMQHPGIAAIFEASLTADGRPFFVMEYIPGEEVTQYCREEQPPLRDRLRLFLQITSAVAHAHQKGVVHRDLKPSNILIAQRPDGPFAKIIDFGVAKSFGGPDPSRTHTTEHGQLVGTLAYMSPEQLAGDPRQVDVRTDIYSLGAVLHEMLTGAPAFDLESCDFSAALRRIEQGQRDHAPLRRGGIPRDLALIIGKAMAVEPHRRYQSVPELEAEIRRFLESRPVLARPPGPLYIMRKFAARHRALVGTASVTGVLLLISAYSVWAQRERAERHYRVSKAAAMSYLQMLDDISDEIGTRSTRRALLARAMEQSRAFSEQEASDPEVQSARAGLLYALADVEAEEGRTLQAQAMFEEVVAVRRRLVALYPRNLDWRADLSVATVRVGDMHQGERAHLAMPYYRAALQIDEHLVTLQPQSSHYVSNLAWSYQRMGARSQAMGEHEGALRYFRLQLEATDRLQSLGGQVDDIERCRASAYNHLAAEAARTGNRAAALEFSKESLRCAQRAFAAAPRSRFAILSVVYAQTNLGMTHLDQANWDEALLIAEDAAARVRPLLAQDPSDAPVLEQFLFISEMAMAATRELGLPEQVARWQAGAREAALGWKGRYTHEELAQMYPLVSRWLDQVLAGPPEQ